MAKKWTRRFGENSWWCGFEGITQAGRQVSAGGLRARRKACGSRLAREAGTPSGRSTLKTLETKAVNPYFVGQTVFVLHTPYLKVSLVLFLSLVTSQIKRRQCPSPRGVQVQRSKVTGWRSPELAPCSVAVASRCRLSNRDSEVLVRGPEPEPSLVPSGNFQHQTYIQLALASSPALSPCLSLRHEHSAPGHREQVAGEPSCRAGPHPAHTPAFISPLVWLSNLLLH